MVLTACLVLKKAESGHLKKMRLSDKDIAFVSGKFKAVGWL